MVSKTGDIRICLYFNDCGTTEIRNNKWYEHWRKYNGEWVCAIHYARLVTNKVRTKEYKKFHDAKYARKLIHFKDKRLNCKTLPRTGFCTFCTNNILDNSCLETHIHHFLYNISNILKHTIELCASCHTIITNKTMNRVRKNKKIIWGL